MADQGQGLYDQDAVLWAEAQAELLRRLARGERVNEQIDWENVIEEVEDVGLNAIRAVNSLLGRAIEHLLKIHGWPEGQVEHWGNEVRAFLSDAEVSWTPSMRHRIDLARTYRRSRLLVAKAILYSRAPDPLPERCPFVIDDLIIRDDTADVEALLAKLRAEAVG